MKVLVVQKKGLGNQLFQYAAGRYFASRYGASLELIREPQEHAESFGRPRPFLLSLYHVSAVIRDRTVLDRTICSVDPKKRPLASLIRLITRAQAYRQPSARDREFMEDLPISASTSAIYIEGNFQAHQYASHLGPEIRKELQLREPPSNKNAQLLDRIRSTPNAVSVHVRRGDYLLWQGGPKALPLKYYLDAMQIFDEKIGRPAYFVFSDDLAFAREILPRDREILFVDNNDETKPHEDLRLMSACRHNIVANSTFSWWGAFLNANPRKLVCAPKNWGLGSEAYQNVDLIPPEWLVIAE
ncbi:MAG: alpha-1,2-fucosyltransferase [Terracidiphilus sp.]